MANTWEEHERPAEWLRRLQEDPSGYHRLLADSGEFALAAYRIARARCQVRPVPTLVPTYLELQLAARELADNSPDETPVPAPTQLLTDCTNAGVTVIAPGAH
jgi:hypothetical protein